jgi:hypothetical protein
VTLRVLCSNPADRINIFRISEWTRISISEPFRYRNDIYQSDIFSSDIGITDVDVGCRISPAFRSMSMPTYASYRAMWITNVALNRWLLHSYRQKNRLQCFLLDKNMFRGGQTNLKKIVFNHVILSYICSKLMEIYTY